MTNTHTHPTEVCRLGPTMTLSYRLIYAQTSVHLKKFVVSLTIEPNYPRVGLYQFMQISHKNPTIMLEFPREDHLLYNHYFLYTYIHVNFNAERKVLIFTQQQKRGKPPENQLQIAVVIFPSTCITFKTITESLRYNFFISNVR